MMTKNKNKGDDEGGSNDTERLWREAIASLKKVYELENGEENKKRHRRIIASLAEGF